jgi:PDZ domain-containing secreted protein
MWREVPKPVAIGVIILVLLLVIGIYWYANRPKSGTQDIENIVKMSPHGPAKTPTR